MALLSSFRIIDNVNTNFQAKVNRCLNTILKYLGLPCATHFYKKFLLKKGYSFKVFYHINLDPLNRTPIPPLPKFVRCEEFDVEEVYLIPHDPENEEKIRRRVKNIVLMTFRGKKNLLLILIL